MMTKSDFEAIADIFNANQTEDCTILDFCNFAEDTNPRFNRKTFLQRAMVEHRINAVREAKRFQAMIE